MLHEFGGAGSGGSRPCRARRKGAWVMTVWFNDLSMTDEAHKVRQRGLDLDVETREAVLRRSQYLDGPDERLLRLALEGNMSYRAMNRVIGLKSGGGTYRRVRSLLRRLR